MPSDFLHDLLAIAISQICQEAGWDAIKHSSLQSLMDVVTKLIEEIGISANTFASLAGRTQSNFLDFNAAFEDIGTDISTLMNYHSKASEIPFGSRLPRFPLNKSIYPSPLPPYSESSSLPPFLPPLPEPRTYIFTPKEVERETNHIKTRKRQIEENRKVEQSLTILHQTGAQLDSTSTYNYQREASAVLNPVANRTQYWGVAASNTVDKKRPRTEPSPAVEPAEGDQSEVVVVNPYLQPPRKAKNTSGTNTT